MAFIDLSHTVEDGMVTYKGLPAPIICDFLSREASKTIYAEGTTFQIGKIEMVSNTGTYIDTPFHRYADGKDLSQIELPQLANLDAVVIRSTEAFNRIKCLRRGLHKGQGRAGKHGLVETLAHRPIL